MGAQDKATVKALFETGDTPTEDNFVDLIDSYQDADGTVNAIVTAAQGGATGVIEIEATAQVTTRPAGAFGVQMLATASTAAASSLLNSLSDPMTTRGDIIFRDASNTTARLPVGATGQVPTSDGVDVAWANHPYDIAFNAGFGSDMTGADIVVQVYGELVMTRSGSFSGEAGYIDTPATGAAAIVDIRKNGTTIYSTLPQFAATANTLTAGTLKTDGTEDFVTGDRITFQVTQVGSSTVGQKLRFTVDAALT